jgi:hypothetical protein
MVICGYGVFLDFSAGILYKTISCIRHRVKLPGSCGHGLGSLDEQINKGGLLCGK